MNLLNNLLLLIIIWNRVTRTGMRGIWIIDLITFTIYLVRVIGIVLRVDVRD